MTIDKRTVTTDALETLGSVISDAEKRDAIHLAVEPVIAGETLMPGQHIGMTNGKAVSTGKLLGIVDPFLPLAVQPGERFWLVVYPRQIRSLRHVWEHPAFPASEAPAPEFDPAARSRAWLKNYADEIGLGYTTLMAGADEWVFTSLNSKWAGKFLCCGDLLEGKRTSDKFWNHYQIVTGRTVPQKYQTNFFSCSC